MHLSWDLQLIDWPTENLLFATLCCMVKICWANTFLNLSEATIRVFLKISQISQEKTCVAESLFNKSWRPATLFKRDSNKVFSCKLCDIFKNAYFEEHVRTASFTLNLIFKTSTVHFVYFLLDRLCFSLYSLIHVINFFLMTSFPYIFPCPFTLLHLLPTAQMLQAHTKILLDKHFWEPNKQHLKL